MPVLLYQDHKNSCYIVGKLKAGSHIFVDHHFEKINIQNRNADIFLLYKLPILFPPVIINLMRRGLSWHHSNPMMPF